jgi:hypothetical protein
MSEAKYICIYFYASSPDAAAWMLKFVFVYLAKTPFYAIPVTMVSLFKSKKTTFRSVFANNSVINLHFMKVSTENDNNFGYEKITIVVDNITLKST